MHPEANPVVPDFSDLRTLYGQCIPSDSRHGTMTQIRPGRWRKVYGQAPVDRYVVRATKFDVRKEVKPLRSSHEIAGEIDKRPLLELRDQINEVMGQIAVRAASGDENAIHNLLAVARAIISVLDTVERAQPEKLQKIAKRSTSWPVLLSQNPQDIAHATEKAKRLNVGEKALTPRRSGQKLDPQSFWTRLAASAVQVCQDNGVIVPVLQSRCEGIVPDRKTSKFWGTAMEASLYYVTSTDCIVIVDWEERCTRLSMPVSENLKAWWDVTKHYVIEYWHSFPEEYAEALRQIGHPDKEEWRRRNLAVDRLEQAFRDLVGFGRASY